MTRRLLSLIVTALLVMPPAPSMGQVTPVPPATKTKAGKGLLWGSVVGGLLGGLAFGTLSAGICDQADCGGAFGEGFFPGLLVGGVGGALVGTVFGAGFPDDGRKVGGWSAGARVGFGGPRDADVHGLGPLVDLYALQGTTERTSFGVAVEYLGHTSRTNTFTITGPGGAPEVRTEVRGLHIGGVRAVAVRLLGSGPGSRGYLVARAGLHPTVERLTFGGGDPEFELTNRSFVLAPGGGVGAGFLHPVSGRWSLHVEARGDVVVGVSSDGIVPVTSLSAGLLRGR